MSFYTELKRRNVFKVAIVYTAVAWLLLQVSDTLGPALHLPDWVVSAVAFLLILGFPVAIILAWAFDLTPEGLRAESSGDSTASKPAESGRNLNHIVLVALVLALGYFALDKYVLSPRVGPVDVENDERVTGQDGTPAEMDRSIAVLPFVNMSSDEEQEYFSDGLSEELLNLLAGIPELSVAARTSAFSFKGTSLSIPEIAEQLNVAHVLEGSVRKHGDQLRITAQLIQADNGYHLWSQTYDRQLDNVFEIQEDIANAVVEALKITLLGESPKMRKTDPVAYQLFLEGQYLKRQISPDSLDKAIDVFRQAVEIDPGYAPAWAELADTYIWGGHARKLSGEERGALAEQAVEMAISSDPDYGFAYYVSGISWFFTRHDFKKGQEEFQRALELDPNDASIVAAIGKGALLTGDFDLAISQYLKALKMDPVVPEFHFFLGRAYLASGHYDEAEASFRKLADLSPTTRYGSYLWQALFLKGDYEAALTASDSSYAGAVVYHAMGNTEMAEKHLAVAMEKYPAYSKAGIFGLRGDVDQAFAWLEEALEEGAYYPTFILTDPAFHSLQSDERWISIMERLGLLEYWLDMTSD